ncbi:hypothetical protein C8F01DRAFT_1143247 [Mycena amicta]|nr:hypothetical protein C8F01DRAFT_1143247 [Mycena amicta]
MHWSCHAFAPSLTLRLASPCLLNTRKHDDDELVSLGKDSESETADDDAAGARRNSTKTTMPLLIPSATLTRNITETRTLIPPIRRVSLHIHPTLLCASVSDGDQMMADDNEFEGVPVATCAERKRRRYTDRMPGLGIR